jgi:hypothetical protein
LLFASPEPQHSTRPESSEFYRTRVVDFRWFYRYNQQFRRRAKHPRFPGDFGLEIDTKKDLPPPRGAGT